MNVSINVVGLGFVGLTTALRFCEKKFSTIFVENDSKKLQNIKNGIVPFKEPF